MEKKTRYVNVGRSRIMVFKEFPNAVRDYVEQKTEYRHMIRATFGQSVGDIQADNKGWVYTTVVDKATIWEQAYIMMAEGIDKRRR